MIPDTISLYYYFQTYFSSIISERTLFRKGCFCFVLLIAIAYMISSYVGKDNKNRGDLLAFAIGVCALKRKGTEKISKWD